MHTRSTLFTRVSRAGLAALATLAATAIVLAGPASAQQRTRVSVAVTEQIVSTNPYADSVTMMYDVFSQTYGTLTDYNFATGRFDSRFAVSWSNPDPLTWVFKLKKGLKRNNGEPVVAADFVHSIERARKDPQSKQQHNVRYIQSAATPDDETLVIKTTEPVAPMLEYFSRLIVTSKAQFDKFGAAADKEAPFGAGPYAIKQISIDNFIALTKVPDHPDAKPGNPDEVIFKLVKEPESRVTAMLNGEVQIAQLIPPQLVTRVETSSVARIVWENSVELMFIAMSPKYPPWDKKEVRQAVAYAIDRDALIKILLNGQASRLDGPIGPGQYAYDPDLQPKYTFNPAKARELLAKAGYPNGGLEVDYYATVSRYLGDKQVSEAIVPMLEAVGFKVNMKTPEWGTLWAGVQKGSLPFYYMGRGTVVDPSAALSQYFETGVSPRIGYSNPQLDALLAAERQEFDEQKRIAILRKAMALVTEEAPAHFLWRHKLATAVANSVDVVVKPTGGIQPVDIVIKAGRSRAK